MAYDVTSWFVEQTLLKTPQNLVRKFTIGSSDYSERVITWPKFKTVWNDIRSTKLNVKLANQDAGMNFMREDKTLLRQNVKFEFGYTHPTSGDELITLFAGKSERVKYQKETTEMTIVDKFKQLSDRVMGSSDVPIDYTSSDYLPADIAWYAITSYGGFDTTADSNNVDINYESWLEWASVFSADGVHMNALFSGTKVSEVLRKIGRHTLSAVYIAEDKLNFHRFSQADTNVTSFDNTNISDLILEFNDADIVNKQYVSAVYDVTSKFHTVTVNDVSTSSVNSFGLREDTEEDKNIWYVNSASAINLAQRKIQTGGEPFDSLLLKTNLTGFTRLVGETISIIDSFHSINDSFRIMSQKIDMDKAIVDFDVDKSQFTSPFILDTSKLDSADVLT